jgi:hypothetical protein
LQYFSQYLRGQILTLEQEVKAGEPEQLAPSHLLLDAKLQEQGDKQELPISAVIFEMLRSCKDPWICGK